VHIYKPKPHQSVADTLAGGMLKSILSKDVQSLSKTEEERLHKVFLRLDSDGDGKISESDILLVLASLDYTPSKYEALEMIWEADENQDGCVEWDEMQWLYKRVRFDKTGLEPRKLFFLIEFLFHDHDYNGSITVDECFAVMFIRYGRNFSEDEIHQLFRGNVDNGSYVTYQMFLEYMVERFMSTYVFHKNPRTTKRHYLKAAAPDYIPPGFERNDATGTIHRVRQAAWDDDASNASTEFSVKTRKRRSASMRTRRPSTTEK